MKTGYVRIIGGMWRGRRLKISYSGIRPTPDRVRETIFNWLTPFINGAHCLDAFAGTGVLGFEALSRGASHVTFIDQSLKVIQEINQTAKLLNAEAHITSYCAISPDHIKPPLRRFNIVFLDPPFSQGDILRSCNMIENQNLLATSAVIYLEAAKAIDSQSLPASWKMHKSKKAGNVAYHLAQRLL